MAENVKIAVIDDEESVLESFKLILQIKDYEAEFFERAEEFLKELKKNTYDLIFLDLWLKKDPPPYNRDTKDGGIEALKKIKEIDPEVEIVIVTGYANDRTHVNAITYGAMEYLSKPFLMEAIYELVNRALQKRRAKKSKKKGGGPIGPIH
jgi:two-component system nitrogen regulation response regulator NtrX